ncbi:hypothetical protein OAO20_04230 [Candidatus Pelagibacter ubique]|nr:hypothetical protein [Candidatus Pelagibacter ubique]
MGVKEQISLVHKETVLDKQIQIYRLHYTYLRICLKYKDEFKVDKSKYVGWDLDFIENQREVTTSFNIWWSKIGRNLFSKKTFDPKIIKSNTIKHLPNSLTIQISKTSPTEYNLQKIREILSKEKEEKKEVDTQRNHYVKLQIYLETWKLNREEELTLRETRRRLVAKRKQIFKRLGNRSAMDRFKTQDFLKFSPPKTDELKGRKVLVKDISQIKSLERQIQRYRTNAKRILKNVCNGEFPGQYSS